MITFRNLMIVTITALVLLLVGACGPDEAGDGLADGTHEGVSDPDSSGYVSVEVVVQDGSIADASMMEYTGDGQPKDPDTYAYDEWAEAKEELPQRLINDGSPDVDTFAGATSTTEKFRQAARRALGEEDAHESGPYTDGVHAGISEPGDQGGHVEVEVYVLLGHIVDVEWEEHDGDGNVKDPDEYDYEDWQEAVDELPARVVDEQGTDFDAVSGATGTSEMFRDAVEDALGGA